MCADEYVYMCVPEYACIVYMWFCVYLHMYVFRCAFVCLHAYSCGVGSPSVFDVDFIG